MTTQEPPYRPVNETGYWGVTECPAESGPSTYRAQLWHEKRTYGLGSYASAFEAAVTHDLVRVALGYDARSLNFPDVAPLYGPADFAALDLPQKSQQLVTETLAARNL